MRQALKKAIACLIFIIVFGLFLYLMVSGIYIAITDPDPEHRVVGVIGALAFSIGPLAMLYLILDS